MDYSADIEFYLKKFFGYDSFLLAQKDVITSILQGNNTVAIFPTGGGKSICYQLPALILPGTTLVISPLISLMKDQVDELKELDIKAAYISSTLSDDEVSKTIKNMRAGLYKIVYVAPERFHSADFLEAIREVSIPFVAVDEAHCVSQWGHNFRPAYLKIKNLIDLIGTPILAAFTATANKKVQEDIERLLGIRGKCNTFVESFDRPNLEFIVKETDDKRSFVLNYARGQRGKSGIIYAATRSNVEILCTYLRDKGIRAGMYHAGLDSVTRNTAQEAFINDEIDVMVATNAFGMGINKKDVRYIIHFNMPKSLENYYQEAGRAGRDGRDSSCILLYSEGDYDLNSFMIGGNYPPVKLVERIFNRIKARGAKGIPQELILKSRNIDRHILHSALRKLYEYSYAMLKDGIVYETYPRDFDLTQEEIDWHKEIEMDRLRAMEKYCEGEKCLRLFILEYFNEKPNFIRCENCSVCKGERYSKIDEKDLDRVLDDILNIDLEDTPSIDECKGQDPNSDLFRRLRVLRTELARETGEAEDIIFEDTTLREIAAIRPVTKKQMLGIKAASAAQVRRFGQEFLREVHRYLKDKRH